MGQAIDHFEVTERATGYVFHAHTYHEETKIITGEVMPKGTTVIFRRVPRIVGPQNFHHEKVKFPAGMPGKHYLRLN